MSKKLLYTANVITKGIVTGSVIVEADTDDGAQVIFNYLLDKARMTEGSCRYNSFIVDIRKIS